jgi:hypothetical protein
MPEDKNGIPFIGHDAAAEILEHAYGITPSDDDCYHEAIEDRLAEIGISLEDAVDLIERLMPMICHGESPISNVNYKGFGKVKIVGEQPQRLEMIGKVIEDFWFTEDENGNLEKGVYKKVES